MATDIERLVVSLEANIKGYENALKRASGLAGKTADDIQKAAKRAGDGFSRGADIEAYGAELDRLRAKFNPVFAASKRYEIELNDLNRALKVGAISAREHEAALERLNGEYQRLAAAAGAAGRPIVLPDVDPLNRSLATTRFQTANVAAQLQDIGVQLSSGTSPFLIAIQQGTQLNQVLGGMGARGALGALGGAFSSLLNPISLATIAIIGLGGVAVQYFTTLLTEGEKSEEQLKQEAQLIQQVADRWGDAVPALKAYADERQRALDQQNLRQVVGARVQDEFAGIDQTVRDLQVSVADLVLQLEQAGAAQSEIAALQKEFTELDAAVQRGEATAQDVKDVQEALAALFSSTSIPIVSELAAEFDELAAAIANVSARANELKAQAAFATLKDNLPALGSVPPVFSSGGQFIDESELQRVRADATKSQTQLEAERAARGGRKEKISEAEREQKAIRDLIDALEFERDLIGATEEERRVAVTLRQAGAYATDEQRQRIEELVIATEREREALERSEEAMRRINDIGREAIGGLISDLIEGKDASEALADALGKVGDRLLDWAFDDIFGGGGKDGGGFFGKILSSILHQGGVVGQGGTTRSVHPGVFAGAPRMHDGGVAGLRPGEVPAILQRGEIVLPKNFRGAGAGGMHVSVGVSVDETGNLQAYVNSVSEATTMAGIKQYDKGTRSRIASALPDLRRRGAA